MQKTQEIWVQYLSQEHPLEEEIAIHCSFPAGKFHGQRSLAVTVHRVSKSWTQRTWTYRHTYWLVSTIIVSYRVVSVQFKFSSVAQSCLTLCDPVNRSMPGLPVHHQLPEFTRNHVHRVSGDIRPSHPLSSTSPPAPNTSQHQGLFHWVNSLHEVVKVLEFQPQHQSFQWTPRTDTL